MIASSTSMAAARAFAIWARWKVLSPGPKTYTSTANPTWRGWRRREFLDMALDEGGVHLARRERRMKEQRPQKFDVGGCAEDDRSLVALVRIALGDLFRDGRRIAPDSRHAPGRRRQVDGFLPGRERTCHGAETTPAWLS